MRILTTILARAGSERLPGKNTKMFNGKPLICWTIEQALELKYCRAADFDIVVSSDSKTVKELASGYHHLSLIDRPEELCDSKSKKMEAIRYVLKETKRQYDAVLDLDVTAPLRRICDIKDALKLYVTTLPDSVVSVVKNRKDPASNQGWVNPLSKTWSPLVTIPINAALKDINAAIYVYSIPFLMNRNHPIGSNTRLYEMEQWQATDIDTYDDFEIVEYLHAKKILRKEITIK